MDSKTAKASPPSQQPSEQPDVKCQCCKEFVPAEGVVCNECFETQLEAAYDDGFADGTDNHRED